jgi:chromosome segregation ATPase
VAKEDKIVVTENRLLLLDEARKRERYQTGQEALETLTTAMQGSALLETFGDDDFKVWQDAEKTVNEARTEINELSGKQKGNQEALQAKQQERQELERSLRIIEEQKQQINIEVKPALGEYEKGKDRMATHSFTRKFWNTTTVASSLLLAVSMIASAIGQTSILYGITGVLLAVAIVCWVYKFRLQTSGVGLVKLMMSINSRLARYGLNGDTFEDIISNIQKFEDDISKKYDEIQEIKKDEAVIAERIRNIVQEDLPREEKKIKESQEMVESLLSYPLVTPGPHLNSIPLLS